MTWIFWTGSKRTEIIGTSYPLPHHDRAFILSILVREEYRNGGCNLSIYFTVHRNHIFSHTHTPTKGQGKKKNGNGAISRSKSLSSKHKKLLSCIHFVIIHYNKQQLNKKNKYACSSDFFCRVCVVIKILISFFRILFVGLLFTDGYRICTDDLAVGLLWRRDVPSAGTSASSSVLIPVVKL